MKFTFSIHTIKALNSFKTLSKPALFVDFFSFLYLLTVKRSTDSNSGHNLLFLGDNLDLFNFPVLDQYLNVFCVNIQEKLFVLSCCFFQKNWRMSKILMWTILCFILSDSCCLDLFSLIGLAEIRLFHQNILLFPVY